MVIGDILERNIWRYPERTALVFENNRITFEEFGIRIYKFANALTDLGLQKGEAIAFIFPHNTIQAQEITFTLTVTGMIIVPLNARFLNQEILYLLDRCDVKALIFDETYSDLILSIASITKKVKIFICIGSSLSSGMYDYETLISESSPIKPPVDVREEDIAALIHTSGTTGMPKEVIWTHKSWLSGSREIVIKFQLTEKDRLLMFTPYFHIPFFWFNMAVYYMGGMVVFIREPNPKLILKTIHDEGITTISHFVPTTLSRILEFPDLTKYDLTTVRWYMYGGSPMPTPLLEKAIPELGNKFIQLYGFTELAGCATALVPEDHIIERTKKEKGSSLSSCGKEMPGSDIRIVNSEGIPVDMGKEGEILY
ncbi:MAG: AMP-binding protein, partial [Thermodesulfobacteriota bacterium]|nr:AMP-binding protein [Thermodesulfobacteriota bacterium]